MPGASAPADPPENPATLAPTASRVAAIDLQEPACSPHVAGGDRRVADRAALLVRGAAALGVAVSATAQAPDKLGPAAEPVAAALEHANARVEPKLAFGAAGALGMTESVSDDRHQIVLCGVETHVCVAQTALELLSAGYAVSVAADACGSRSPVDHAVALDRLRAEGASITTVEAVLFEWCRTAENPAFAALRDLMKAAGPAGQGGMEDGG